MGFINEEIEVLKGDLFVVIELEELRFEVRFLVLNRGYLRFFFVILGIWSFLGRRFVFGGIRSCL